MTRKKPRVLIHEYTTGGGLTEFPTCSGLFAEGIAMLTAIVTDFSNWGKVDTVVPWDNRLDANPPQADDLVMIDTKNYRDEIGKLASTCEAALIVAPESEGVLAEISDLVQQKGVHLLGSEPAAINLAANKWDLYQKLAGMEIATPKTWLVDAKKARILANQLPMPLVIKPVDGVDCMGVFVARKINEFNHLIDLHYQTGEFLLQPFVEGVSTSVSLLVSDQLAVSLSLNEQRILGHKRLEYDGGVVPAKHRYERQAKKLAREAATLIPGLRGYIGIDMILTQAGPTILEINPRITTSYIGLRQVSAINLAQAIWNACINGQLPKQIETKGQVAFHRDGFSA